MSKVPKAIAACPVCGASIFFEIDAVAHDGGNLTPVSITITCEHEPDDIGSDEWDDFDEGHFADPTPWYPIESKIEDWLKQPEQQALVKSIWR